jgi:hypothetical protein
MPIDYKKYPTNWRSEIRPDILKRDEYCCKFCRVPNHSVGCRDSEGKFFPTCGNIAHDLAGKGLSYPSLQPISYKEAKGFADINNSFGIESDPTEYRYIVIVLTIAHLDHDITNNDYENLAALCQRCHNIHDREDRNRHSKETSKKKKGLQNLF